MTVVAICRYNLYLSLLDKSIKLVAYPIMFPALGHCRNKAFLIYLKMAGFAVKIMLSIPN